MKQIILFLLAACLLFSSAIAGTLSIGDIITIGTYEQDNNFENGPEPIEWKVLLTENDEALLISVMGLDAVPYHEPYEKATWANCTLRAWLNGTFLETAFSADELEFLIPSVLVNDDNSSFRTLGGETTEDLIFILSANECKQYLTPAVNRQLKPTAYAKEMGVYPMSRGKNAGNCWWWLRTPGSVQDMAAYVKDDGALFYKGIDVDYLSAAVRPAVRIRISLFEKR